MTVLTSCSQWHHPIPPSPHHPIPPLPGWNKQNVLLEIPCRLSISTYFGMSISTLFSESVLQGVDFLSQGMVKNILLEKTGDD